MNPSQWQQVERIFLAASDLEGEAREHYLDEQCPDPAIRAEVDRLFEADPPATFLGTPALRGVPKGPAPGQQLGHYEIIEELGAGGSGIVFKARDTRPQMDRIVAVKVLRPEEALGPDSRHRFLREAQAASSLNHPNIVSIFDTGAASGWDYLVMEYVEGSTLRNTIPSSGLKPDAATAFALQIAEALASAHEAGIIHRDLKPGNIMVTERGHIKVLDFGLAKRITRTKGTEATVSMHTAKGTLLGTFAYMAPEQAEGKPSDKRSDIFSFGCVLYEMLTGHRAFEEDTDIRTLAAVLEREPRPITEFVPKVSDELAHIVKGCIQKDPAARWQDMRDVRLQLEQVLRAPEAAPKPPGRRRLPIAAVAAGMAAAAALGWFARTWLQSERAEPMLTMLTADSGLSAYPAISRDGSMLAFASDRGGQGNLDIWVMQIQGREPKQLTSDEADETDPAISPDGSRVAFRSERDGGGIYVMPTLGGTPVLLAPGGRNPRFSPDGRFIAYWMGREVNGYFPGSARVMIVPAGGGKAEQIHGEFAAMLYPVWSPGGDRLLVLARRDANQPVDASLDWWVVPVGNGSAEKTGLLSKLYGSRLSHATGAARFTALEWTGSRVIFAATSGDAVNLWELPAGPEAIRFASPRRLTMGTGFEAQAAAVPGPHLKMAFASLSLNFDVWQVPLDNAGRAKEPVRLTDALSIDIFPSMAGDGGRLAYLTRRSDIWFLRVKELALRRDSSLLDTATPLVNTRISWDGKHAVFADTEGKIFAISTSGGPVQTPCAECGSPTDLSRDASTVLFEPSEPPEHVMALNVSNGQRKVVVQNPGTGLALSGGRFSPDGKWVVFHTIAHSDGTSQVYAAPYDAQTPAARQSWIAISEGASSDREPCWSDDGRRIYFISERDGYRCVWSRGFDPATGRPSGTSSPAIHFHHTRRSMQMLGRRLDAVGLHAAAGKLVLTLGELTGNIWLTERKP